MQCTHMNVCRLDLAFLWLYCVLLFICVKLCFLGLFSVRSYLCVCALVMLGLVSPVLCQKIV